MSHPSDFCTTRTGGASGAEVQSTLRPQHADRLPAWLCLWLPLAVAAVLVLAWLLAPEFYRDSLGGEIGFLELAHVIIPLRWAAYCPRILVLNEVRTDRLASSWTVPVPRAS